MDENDISVQLAKINQVLTDIQLKQKNMDEKVLVSMLAQKNTPAKSANVEKILNLEEQLKKERADKIKIHTSYNELLCTRQF